MQNNRYLLGFAFGLGFEFPHINRSHKYPQRRLCPWSLTFYPFKNTSYEMFWSCTRSFPHHPPTPSKTFPFPFKFHRSGGRWGRQWGCLHGTAVHAVKNLGGFNEHTVASTTLVVVAYPIPVVLIHSTCTTCFVLQMRYHHTLNPIAGWQKSAIVRELRISTPPAPQTYNMSVAPQLTTVM